MKIKNIKIQHCIFLVMFALCGCAGTSKIYDLNYEVRAPKTLKIDPMTKIEEASDYSMGSAGLNFAKAHEDGEFVIFPGSGVLDTLEKRHAIIVSPPGQPSQVFVLTIPRRIQPTDWSEWQRPNYKDSSDASGHFMDDVKWGRFTNIRPDSFEIRFKIQDVGPFSTNGCDCRTNELQK
jgi:hypothetical protein